MDCVEIWRTPPEKAGAPGILRIQFGKVLNLNDITQPRQPALLPRAQASAPGTDGQAARDEGAVSDWGGMGAMGAGIAGNRVPAGSCGLCRPRCLRSAVALKQAAALLARVRFTMSDTRPSGHLIRYMFG